MAPVLGELAFFTGIPQPVTIRARWLLCQGFVAYSFISYANLDSRDHSHEVTRSNLQMNGIGRPDGDVQLLVLSRADCDELFDSYPEQVWLSKPEV